jgi:hypothetical protein
MISNNCIDKMIPQNLKYYFRLLKQSGEKTEARLKIRQLQIVSSCYIVFRAVLLA